MEKEQEKQEQPKRGRRVADITGKQFGRLTALYRLDKKKKAAATCGIAGAVAGRKVAGRDHIPGETVSSGYLHKPGECRGSQKKGRTAPVR